MNYFKDIYLIDAIALAKELRNGTFSEFRAIKHLIVGMILGGIGFKVPISVEWGKDSIDAADMLSGVIMFLLTGIITYYGVWLVHQVNGKGDGKDFFFRFAALTLPIGVRLSIIFLAVSLVLLVLAKALTTQLGANGSVVTQLLFYAATLAFTMMFFIRMRNYVAIAAGVGEKP